MSTAPYPSLYPSGIPQALAHHIATAAASRKTRTRSHIVRRRPDMRQGQALELLGHAIEYLIDSRMHESAAPASRADVEAGQILMRLNREVFGECREIVPAGRALRNWVQHLFAFGRI